VLSIFGSRVPLQRFRCLLLFCGLHFFHLLKQDYVELMKGVPSDLESNTLRSLEDISFGLMNGIYRCTALGIVITIMMKLQSDFLHSGSSNIVQWLIMMLDPFSRAMGRT
jgi:hypothetical protein